MTFRGYIIAMLIGTLLSWAAWALILWRINPDAAGTVGFILFYTSLLLSLLGTFALLGLVFRHLRVRQKFLVEKVVTSFRQGLWFGVVIIAALILQSKGLLTWINVALVVGIVTIMEFFFLSALPQVHTDQDKKVSTSKYI